LKRKEALAEDQEGKKNKLWKKNKVMLWKKNRKRKNKLNKVWKNASCGSKTEKK